MTMANKYDGTTIEVVNWDKFNGRKDVKSPSWFKFSHSFFEDPDFYDFTPSEIIAWIYILCLASKKSSSTVRLNFLHADRIARLKERDLESAIEKLCKIKCANVDVTCALRERDVDVTFTYAREEEIREEYTARPTFDLEAAYRRYPRKEGKSRGLKKLKSEIKTQDDFDKLILAVENYASTRRGEDPKFTKHFSTFVSEWRDWIEVEKKYTINVTPIKLDLGGCA